MNRITMAGMPCPQNPTGEYYVLNKAGSKPKKASLDIYDYIGDPWDGTTAKGLRAELKELPESVKEIDVYINSPGGYIFDGLSIYEALVAHPAIINVTIGAIAGSIASVIAMAGDTRRINEFSDFYIHRPQVGAHGYVEKLQQMVDLLNKKDTDIRKIYMDSAGIEADKLDDLMADDGTWISAEDAIELGFATELIEAEEKAVAYAFDPSGLKNCPKHHIRMYKAFKKRKEEGALRDAGQSHREAKTNVSTLRDAGVDHSDLVKDLSQMLKETITT